MKTKCLLTIAALLGLSLIPALPSHAQRSNPCKDNPAAKPSRETRQIRVEKYGIAFNIPENYRTRSHIKENYMSIFVYNPSAFSLLECLITNKIPGSDDFWSSTILISQRQASINLIDIAGEILSGRPISNISNLTIAMQPAIRYNTSDGYSSSERVEFLFLPPTQKYFVRISVPNVSAALDGNALAETIKSSFNFDLSSSPYSVTTSSSVSQASNNPAIKLLNGVYVGEGTMFNNSHREVLSRNNRLCIKFVDGPISPYSGRQEITISSLSLRSGKLFTDSYYNDTELEAIAGEDLKPPYSTFLYKDVKAAFRHTGRTYWVYRGKTLYKINPEMDKDLQECVTSQGVYKKTRKGAVIDGIKPSW